MQFAVRTWEKQTYVNQIVWNRLTSTPLLHGVPNGYYLCMQGVHAPSYTDRVRTMHVKKNIYSSIYDIRINTANNQRSKTFAFGTCVLFSLSHSFVHSCLLVVSFCAGILFACAKLCEIIKYNKGLVWEEGRGGKRKWVIYWMAGSNKIEMLKCG